MQHSLFTEGFGRSVTVYRAYRRNAAGHIMSAQWLDAQSDVEAEVLAESLCGPGFSEVELWCGSRLVGAMPCHSDEGVAP